MFLNIQIDLLILETYYGQFTLTIKKSLHIIFKDLRPATVLINVPVQHAINNFYITYSNCAMKWFKVAGVGNIAYWSGVGPP